MFEHLLRPLIDASVERLAWRIEPETNNVKSPQRVAALLPQLSHWAARGETDLDSANEFGNVVGVNPFRGGWIEAFQDAVQMLRTFFRYTFAHPLAQFLR